MIKSGSFFPNHPDAHIYIIGRRPRITINPNSVSFVGQSGYGILSLDKAGQQEKYPFKTPVHGRSEKNQFTSDYPFTDFLIKNKQTNNTFSKGKVAFLASKIGFKDKDFLNLEVLYIGQSFGRNQKRTALERLKNHSTLQNIYSDASQKSPDQEVWIVLCSFEEQDLWISIDGTRKALIENEADTKRAVDILSQPAPTTEQQLINLIEAALIKYFQPKYNKEYKDTFPTPKHSEYSEYYNLDFNEISISIGTENIFCRLWSQSIPPEWTHCCRFPLHPKDGRMGIFEF